MPMQWRAFLDVNRIEYVETGPNVAKGNINIACPMCGDDPSHHLGINEETGYWGCWRNAEHRGKSAVRLVKALLNTNQSRSIDIVKRFVVVDRDPSGYKNLLENEKRTWHHVRNPAPKQFAAFSRLSALAVSKPGYFYLREDRGYKSNTRKIIEKHNLKYATAGLYRRRIIMPIYDRDKRLVSFTSRSVDTFIQPRYLDLDTSNSDTPAKDCLYNIENILSGGKILVLCEGPFDAISLDWIGEPYGIRAAALFTVSMGEAQQYQVFEIAERFDEVVVCFDHGAEVQAAVTVGKLRGFVSARSFPTPEFIEDLGEIHKSPEVGHNFIDDLLGESDDVEIEVPRSTRRLDS